MTAVVTRGPAWLTPPVQTAVTTLACAAAALAGPAPLAAAGGLLLGFVLPGLALTAIVFRNRTLSAVERTVLAPALSLAVLVTAGLLLHVAGFALNRTSWTLAVAGATLLALALKAVPDRVWQGEESEFEYEYVEADEAPERERATSPAGAETVRIQLGDAPTAMIPAVPDRPAAAPPRVPPGPFAPWSAQQRVERGQLARQLLPMVLVLAVLAGAGYLSFASSYESYDVTVTALSAEPPGPVAVSGDRVVEVTASGLVAGDGPYTVAVTDPAGARLVERTVMAGARGTWTAALTLPAARRLTVGLFRAGDTTAYRTLIIAAAGQ